MTLTVMVGKLGRIRIHGANKWLGNWKVRLVDPWTAILGAALLAALPAAAGTAAVAMAVYLILVVVIMLSRE